MYLLDTSAFRSMSSTIMQSLKTKGHVLYASPYCFWEILTHLDEVDETHSFARCKGQLMKFQHVQMLDNPRTEIDQTLYMQSSNVHKRVPDNELIGKVLSILRESNSLDEFYSVRIEDSQGSHREIRDCVIHTRNILENDETKYKETITAMLQVLYGQRAEFTEAQKRHQLILDFIEAREFRRYKEQQEIISKKLRENLEALTYVYYSYILHRLLKNYNTTSNIDGNDYEDGLMSLHLRLVAPFYCLVTDDKGTKKALEQTYQLLERFGKLQARTIPLVTGIKGLTG